MNLTEFLRQRPCLEELDGYLDAIKQYGGDPATDLEYREITADMLKEIEVYRQRLMKGRLVPAPSSAWRAWEYTFGKPPRKKPGPPPPSPAQSPGPRFVPLAAAPTSDRADTQGTYLVAKPRW